MSRRPDYIVVRVAPGARLMVPPDLDGTWFDRQDIPAVSPLAPPGPAGGVVAVPTNRFEVRDDGAVAEVWEVRP